MNTNIFHSFSGMTGTGTRQNQTEYASSISAANTHRKRKSQPLKTNCLTLGVTQWLSCCK